MVKSKDYTGKSSDAHELARRIQEYWHARGFRRVRVWVERDVITQRKPIYLIRSENIPVNTPS
jgi:hypothetical protein